RLACHLEEYVAEPPVGRIAEPPFLQDRVLEADIGLREPIAEQCAQLWIVLGPLVRRAGRIGEVDAEKGNTALFEHRMGDDPGGRPDVATSVEARQAVRAMKTERNALGPIVVV